MIIPEGIIPLELLPGGKSNPLRAFHEAQSDGLRILGNDDIVLKEERYEARLFGLFLPTGFGKSVSYQLLSIPLSDTILLLG